jgi:hypothetical protein
MEGPLLKTGDSKGSMAQAVMVLIHTTNQSECAVGTPQTYIIHAYSLFNGKSYSVVRMNSVIW